MCAVVSSSDFKNSKLDWEFFIARSHFFQWLARWTTKKVHFYFRSPMSKLSKIIDRLCINVPPWPDWPLEALKVDEAPPKGKTGDGYAALMHHFYLNFRRKQRFLSGLLCQNKENYWETLYLCTSMTSWVLKSSRSTSKREGWWWIWSTHASFSS